MKTSHDKRYRIEFYLFRFRFDFRQVLQRKVTVNEGTRHPLERRPRIKLEALAPVKRQNGFRDVDEDSDVERLLHEARVVHGERMQRFA